MSFPPYTAYKDSGIEWLPHVPTHWTTAPIRELARDGPEAFTDGDWIESPHIVAEGVRLIQTGNIGVGCYREQGFRYVSEDTFYQLGCTEVTTGDVLICRLAGPVGRACVAPALDSRMITSVDVCILKLRSGIDARFIVYALSSAGYLGFMDSVCRGGTRDRVSRSFLSSVRLPVPSLSEQTIIVSVLDRKTAQIDVLVSEQQQLIKLLDEKRRSIISHAVTRGLAPHVPMKSSGIGWLGDVPAHWGVVPLKRLIAAGTSISYGIVHEHDGAIRCESAVGQGTRFILSFPLAAVAARRSARV